jgi:hypothetical protein
MAIRDEKKYKILYISNVMNSEPDHRETLYIITRSKSGLTLDEIRKIKKPKKEYERILGKVFNMRPFDN